MTAVRRVLRSFSRFRGDILRRVLKTGLVILLSLLILTGSSLSPGDRLEQIRYFTRAIEYDFVGWTFQAIGVKLEQAILGTASYIPEAEKPGAVLAYLDLLRRIFTVEQQVEAIYADPNILDPEAASASLRQELAILDQRRRAVEPVAETILQRQIGEVVAEAGLAFGGQTVPPALYHTTPPPHALIVSPRETIRQDFNISISPQTSVEDQAALEEQVDRKFDVSSLVVGIGGIGLYPTMVMETTDINWLAEVVAHEWIHNFLTLRPLGINYLASPALRTMNETVASIGGKELGRQLVGRFYPDFLPPPEPAISEPVAAAQQASPGEEVPFNFRAEMRQTRVWVDKLLAEGKIQEAEYYMEARRRFFWDNGYRLRKLNQAYFAFYGAYADEPGGGAAGEDPVGEAVRLLRQQSASLGAFINQVSWMVSFEQLQEVVARNR